jgi:hypothetical protein
VKELAWLLLLCAACESSAPEVAPTQLSRADRAHLAWVALAALDELDDGSSAALATVSRLREQPDALVRQDEFGAVLLDLDPEQWLLRPARVIESIAPGAAREGEREALEQAFSTTRDESAARRLAAVGGWSPAFLREFHALAMAQRDGAFARCYRDALANDPELARRAAPLLLRDLASLERCEMAAIALSRCDYDAQAAFDAVMRSAAAQIEDERVRPRTGFACIVDAEDWARYMSFPDAARALSYLGPRVLPCALEFLERE